MGAAEAFAAQAAHELALFAAVGIAIGGLDDLLVDLIWLVRSVWRRLFVYSRHDRAVATGLGPAGRVAVFVPAWQEAGVIGAMLETAAKRWHGADYCLYVGCYFNDSATQAAVPNAPHLRLVINPRGIM